jgi:hypothetical protein
MYLHEVFSENQEAHNASQFRLETSLDGIHWTIATQFSDIPEIKNGTSAAFNGYLPMKYMRVRFA